MEQARKPRPAPKRGATEASPESSPAAQVRAAEDEARLREERRAATDELLDEIDDLLGTEQEAAEFVREYKQKGGE